MTSMSKPCRCCDAMNAASRRLTERGLLGNAGDEGVAVHDVSHLVNSTDLMK